MKCFLCTMVMTILLALAGMTAAEQKTLVVASDGSGDFTTVQAAVDAVPAKSDQRTIILIKPGTYKERIRVGKDKWMVTFRGQDPEKTILTCDYTARTVEPAATQPVGTSGSYSTLIEGRDFVAENITFQNTAGDVGQAVALRSAADRAVYRNCRFLGWQDTLYVHTYRAYFKDCYIEGRVDFIFGRATAVFENCHIHSKNGGYVTAAATQPDQPYGFVFLNCKLTGEGDKAYLGRPWREHAAVAFINCHMGEHIRPEGWHNWNKPEAEKTARFFEYNSTGPGANPAARVSWSRQLTQEEAAQYTVKNVLGPPDDWDPTAQ